ncbi:MAG: molybdate ABC transporter substrate-binding protein [Myxococcota bacterium]
MTVLWWLLACQRAPDTLTVAAASSLTDAFGDLAARFEDEHPGVQVDVTFAGSQTLATQLRHGLPADVFASADPAHVDALRAEGLVADAAPFARNQLVLAVAADAPPVDLAHLPDVARLVVGDDEVPVGRYTATLLDRAAARYGAAWREAVEARVRSREPNVRLVLAKLALGEADAAIVYATDAAGVAGIRAVALPADLAPEATYVQARVLAGPQPALAADWLALVAGPGRELLTARGFAAP